MHTKIVWAGVLIFCWLLGVESFGDQFNRPKLVILISIDQMRSDYLTRYEDLYLPAQAESPDSSKRKGGFRFLQENGAWFVDARHDHYPLFTGPGHAVELTGAHPYKSGIVGNYWFDRATRTNRYCVEDSDSPIVGNPGKTKLPSVSPRALQVSTVPDELKMATAGKSKVWAIGLKDRAAILMSGHLADGAYWFDEESGNWVTSRYYATNGTLRGWVKDFNESGLLNKLTNGVWNFEKTKALDPVWSRTEAGSHALSGTNYHDFTLSPSGNDFVFQFAERLIEKENLGNGSDEKGPRVSDLLAINLSSNDYVGHTYGPDSPEMLDITLQTDVRLSQFFNWLDTRKLLTETLVILTSDHGVSPLPAQMKSEAHFDGGRGFEADVEATANQFLSARYGLRGTNSPVKVVEFNVYIDSSRLGWTNEPPARMRAELARRIVEAHASSVYAAYTEDQILSAALPRTDVAARIMNGFYPGRSGDIVMVPQPYWIQLNSSSKKYVTSHGSPYSYDTSVPLILMGPGVEKKRVTERVSTLDIAPTVSFLLGVLAPSGSEGKLLPCLGK